MMPLSMAPSNIDCCLVEIRGGEQVKRRLEALGLTPGVCVSVVAAHGDQPLILAVKDTRIAVGRGVAHKIMIALPDGEHGDQSHGNNP